MADRAPPPHLRPGVSRITRAATSAAAGVRRNLFQSQLTRRPTTAETTRLGPPGGGGPASSTAATTATIATTTSSSSASADALRLDVDMLPESTEIVIRDKNGEFEVDDPPTPPLDDPEDDAALDDAQENERERQRLAEAVRHHQANYTLVAAQPEEVMETLKASMRAKVAALAEDNWMYEAEEPPHVH
ncbi:hypothetical protein GGR51DRAFT_41 [Nemania sp. FL0031]|nr:hypothetical protein GGR51DRAFT_41 [Nemania sp. FL0031]